MPVVSLCHDDCDCKPKRRHNRYGRRRSKCKRGYQPLSSRCRTSTIASAGAIVVAMHVATSPKCASALSSWIDAKTGVDIVSTTTRPFTTGTPPAVSPLVAPRAPSSAHGYGDLVDSIPCLGHASSDDSSSSNNGTRTPRRINYFVVGTSHFRCNSADEVERIIREIGPDGVIQTCMLKVANKLTFRVRRERADFGFLADEGQIL